MSSFSRVPGPLRPDEVDRLATFNAEAFRGIAHTPDWLLAMKVLQEAFDKLAGPRPMPSDLS